MLLAFFSYDFSIWGLGVRPQPRVPNVLRVIPYGRNVLTNRGFRACERHF